MRGGGVGLGLEERKGGERLEEGVGGDYSEDVIYEKNRNLEEKKWSLEGHQNSLLFSF